MKTPKRHSHGLYKISLKALLKDDQGRYLILKSAPNSPYFSGYYDLPGGRINEGETKIDFHRLIAREIKEEAGPVKYKLRPDPVALSQYQFHGNHKIFYILFEAKYLSGKVKISDEHTAYQWQKLDRRNIKKLFHPVLQQLLLNYFDWNPNP